MAIAPAAEPGLSNIEAPLDIPENADIIFSPSSLRRTSSSTHSTVPPTLLAAKWASLRDGAKGNTAGKSGRTSADDERDFLIATHRLGAAPEGEAGVHTADASVNLDNVAPLERQHTAVNVDQSVSQRSGTTRLHSSDGEDLSCTGNLPSLSSWASDAAQGNKEQYAAMYAASVAEKVM